MPFGTGPFLFLGRPHARPPLNVSIDAYLIGCARQIIGLDGIAIVLHHPTQISLHACARFMVAKPCSTNRPDSTT